jgi:hypothetical protein
MDKRSGGWMRTFITVGTFLLLALDRAQASTSTKCRA